MRTYSLLCGAVIATLSLLNTAGAMAQTAAAPAPQMASAWAKSVKITAITVPQTDVSSLLGLHMWRFVATAPKPVHEIRLVVEAQEAGKPPHGLAEISVNPQNGWPLNNQLSIFVGQCPLYDNLGMSTKAKYQVGVSSFRSAPLTEQGSNSSSRVCDNPLNGMPTSTSGTPNQRPDGSFVLSYGMKNHDQPMTSPGDAALVFRVEEQAN